MPSPQPDDFRQEEARELPDLRILLTRSSGGAAPQGIGHTGARRPRVVQGGLPRELLIPRSFRESTHRLLPPFSLLLLFLVHPAEQLHILGMALIDSTFGAALIGLVLGAW